MLEMEDSIKKLYHIIMQSMKYSVILDLLVHYQNQHEYYTQFETI